MFEQIIGRSYAIHEIVMWNMFATSLYQAREVVTMDTIDEIFEEAKHSYGLADF